MMWAFRPERGGYAAKADDTERSMIKGLASDVCTMLGVSVEHVLEERQGREEARLEAEDFTEDPLALYAAELADLELLEDRIARADGPRADSEISIGGHANDGKRIPMDEAIARLLPDMSEDPELARDLRNITQDSVATAKIENLATFYAILNGTDGRVWISNDEVSAWLAACNDIRLVLAARLGIVDSRTAQDTYTRAAELTGNGESGETPEIETTDDLLAVLYSLLSWWQESLLLAVGNKARRK